MNVRALVGKNFSYKTIRMVSRGALACIIYMGGLTHVYAMRATINNSLFFNHSVINDTKVPNPPLSGFQLSVVKPKLSSNYSGQSQQTQTAQRINQNSKQIHFLQYLAR